MVQYLHPIPVEVFQVHASGRPWTRPHFPSGPGVPAVVVMGQGEAAEMDGWMDRWADGWTGGWADVQIDGLSPLLMGCHVDSPELSHQLFVDLVMKKQRNIPYLRTWSPDRGDS